MKRMNACGRVFCAACGLFVIMAVLALVPQAGYAVCPSGQPDEIFCDDFDWYCKYGDCGLDPSQPCPADNSCPKSTSVRNVWRRTSKNCSGSQFLGPDWNIEENTTTRVFSPPFGNSLSNNYNAPVLAHSTVTIYDDIQAVHGQPAVIGTDEHPLVMSVNLIASASVFAHNTVFELTYGKDPPYDYANTDFVLRDVLTQCPSCSPDAAWQESAMVLCAQNQAIPGCPDISSAPVRKSIAAGYVAWLDPDPCYEDGVCSPSRNNHLAFYDGRLWWKLTEGLFPGSGSFTVYPNNHMAALKLSVMTSTVKIEYWSYNESSIPPGGLTTREYSVAIAPRAYVNTGVAPFGAFDTLHAGIPGGCQIGADTGWQKCVDSNANWACDRPRKYVPGAGRQIVDDFVLYGGEPAPPAPPPLGACCQASGQCTQSNEADCEQAGGFYQGDNLACGTVPCRQACAKEPYAGADQDGDIDMDDFAEFQKCFNPAGVAPGCGCFDRGNGFPDGKIDQADFEAFRACATGANVPFVAAEHPDCPPHPGIPAPLWLHENFESYVDGSGQPDPDAFGLAWPRWLDMGYGIDLVATGGIDGPIMINGTKTEERRHVHSLAPHIQAVPTGEGKTLASGTDEAPLVFEAAYQLSSDADLAQQQDFFWDLSRGDDMAPRGYSGALRSCIAFGAFTNYPGLGQGKRAGLMVYDGQKWTHLTSLRHGVGWHFLGVKIRTNTMEITYYDTPRTHGVQKLLLNRVYKGAFDKLAINTDVCALRVAGADGFKLSGGVFQP